MKFNELGLDSALLESIEKMGFEEATPIQAQTIPKALAGLDVIGQAQTGTGKTASFGFKKSTQVKKAYKDLLSHQLVNLRFKHKKNCSVSDATKKFVYKRFTVERTSTVKSAN